MVLTQTLQRPRGVPLVIDGIGLTTYGTSKLQFDPTLAEGDVQVSKDGGAFANLATLPVVTPASDTSVRVELNAEEMDADWICVRFHDPDYKWDDFQILIETQTATWLRRAHALVGGTKHTRDASSNPPAVVIRDETDTADLITRTLTAVGTVETDTPT